MSPILKIKPIRSTTDSKISRQRNRPPLISVRDNAAPQQAAISADFPQKVLKLVGAALVAVEVTLVLLTRYISVKTGKNFFTEHTFFTMFSTMQIMTVGLISLTVAALTFSNRHESKKAYAWTLAGFYAFFLAVDEWFEVHEAVAKHSGELYKALNIQLKPSYWDAPLFLVYLAVAGALWSVLRHDLKKIVLTKYSIAAAGVSLVLSMSFDMGMHRILPVAWEDGFKLIGFMFIGLAFAGVAAAKYTLIKENDRRF